MDTRGPVGIVETSDRHSPVKGLMSSMKGERVDDSVVSILLLMPSQLAS